MLIYNTLTRKLEEFKPINPPNVGIYTCGPTVYREIHIGNFRTYLTTDILVRTLSFLAYKVYSVMNITDVGHMRQTAGSNQQIDPIIQEALQQGKSPYDIAEFYTQNTSVYN
jgi:cysteinyl-tRNA synthetase